MSEQPWNREARGSGDTGVLEAMSASILVKSRLRGRELPANGRESPGRAD
jgi:hypothetical protein